MERDKTQRQTEIEIGERGGREGSLGGREGGRSGREGGRERD